MQTYNYFNLYNNNYLRSCKDGTLNLKGEKAQNHSLNDGFKRSVRQPSGYMYDFGSNMLNCNFINFKNIYNIHNLFYNCRNLNSLNTINGDMSSINDLSNAFIYCINLKTLDVSNGNMSNAKNLSGMFQSCSNLTTIDASEGNVENVTDFSSLFSYCPNLTTLNIENWHTKRAQSFHELFRGCTNVTEFPIDNGNIENVSDLSGTFRDITSKEKFNIGKGNIENVKNFEGMFYTCSNLKEVDNISNGKFHDNIESLSGMFFYCNNLNSLNISNGNLGKANLTNLFYGCKNLITVDVSNGIMNNVKNISGIFYNCVKLQNIDISNGNVSNVENMSGMFQGCQQLKNLNISNWNIINAKYINYAFANCKNLNKTTLDVSNGDTSNIISMANIFENCNSLTVLDVSNGNIHNVTNLSGAFTNCNKLTTLNVSNGNLKNVQYLNQTFNGCYNLQALDVSNGNIDNVTNLAYTFAACRNLTNLDISNGNIDKVVSLAYTFGACDKLIDLDASNGNINNVTNISRLFYETGRNCNGNCDYSNDYTGVQYFGGSTYNFIPHGNFSNVTNMSCFLLNTSCGYIPLYSIRDDSQEPGNIVDKDGHTEHVVDMTSAFSFNAYLPYGYKVDDGASYNINGPDGQTNGFFNFNNVTKASGAFSANSYGVTMVEDSDFSDVKVMGADYLLYINNTEKILDAGGMFAMAKPCNSMFATNELLSQYAMPTFNIQTPILNLKGANNIANIFYNYQPIVTNGGNGTGDYDNGKGDGGPTGNSMKKTLPTLILYNVVNLYQAYYNTRTSIDTTDGNLKKVTNITNMFAYCHALDNNSLKNIAQALLTITNISTTYKQLSSTHAKSPFYMSSKYINNTTVGTDLVTQLRAAGGTVPE